MSVAEIHARIASIQGQFAPFLPSPVPVSGTHGRQHDFATELERAAGPMPITTAAPGNLPDGATQWMPYIEQAAKDAGIDPKLVTAVAWTESGFNPKAVSGAGALGLMQLMPGTAAGLGVDARDPIQNLRGGATYLAQQLDRFGSVDLALAAYNAGPGNVAKHGGIPPFAETQRYVATVLDRLRTL